MTTIFGSNEAETRLRAQMRQSNPGGIEYPSNTNGRGHEGGRGEQYVEGRHKHREHHADGDMVGQANPNPMMMGSQMPPQQPQYYAEGGDVEREEHGIGDIIGDIGGLFGLANGGQVPSQGGSNMAPDFTGNLKGETRGRMRAQNVRQANADSGREEHGWGDFVHGLGQGFNGVMGVANKVAPFLSNFLAEGGQPSASQVVMRKGQNGTGIRKMPGQNGGGRQMTNMYSGGGGVTNTPQHLLGQNGGGQYHGPALAEGGPAEMFNGRSRAPLMRK